MPYIGINVSDLETSLAFYEKFGYTSVTPLEQTEGSLAEARAWGLDQPFRIRGADIAIARGDRHVLRLGPLSGCSGSRSPTICRPPQRVMMEALAASCFWRSRRSCLPREPHATGSDGFAALRASFRD
jgi:hypothetical protein